MFESQEITPTPDPASRGLFLKERLLQFQKKDKQIGHRMNGAELGSVNLEGLTDSDLALFDRIDQEEVHAGNVMLLEKAIASNFLDADSEKDLSRRQFEAFLRNLLLSKWYEFLENQKSKTVH